jgi:hypothetical protein
VGVGVEVSVGVSVGRGVFVGVAVKVGVEVGVLVLAAVGVGVLVGEITSSGDVHPDKKITITKRTSTLSTCMFNVFCLNTA